MKKLLLRVLSAAFVMLLSFALLSFTITVAADATGGMNTDALTYELDLSGVSQNGLKFKIDTQTSTAYVNGAGSPLASTDVVIPSYVLTSAGETYPVTSITSYAFNGRTDITSVTLPSTLTAIKQDAFKDCSGIGSVYISDLEAYLKIEYGSYQANPLYFAGKLYLDSSLVSDLVVPEAVTKINGYALISGSFESITLHDKITEIGMYAFYGCKSITSLSIPDSVTDIGIYAFRECTSLKSVTLSKSLKLINNALFYGSGIQEIVIPEGVEAISYYAFYNCASLTKVTIPSSVTMIGSKAFYNCSKLGVVHISDLDAWCRITFDKDYYSNPAFYSKKLYLNGIRVTEVKFPDGIEKVSDFVFVNCINIKTVSLPASVTSIGEKAFYNINNLTSIVIPRDVTSIGVDAFRGCDYLSDITLWGKVGSIGNDAFYGCSRLKNVYYLGTSDEYAAMTVGTNNESFTGATLNYFCKHAWSEWSVASQPTCIDEGLEQRTCGICEQTETQAVDALDHDYGLTETVEPDCTSDGYSVYTCTRCGDWYYDDFEATLGHAFMHEYIIDVEPTCTERGEAHTMCERCYHVEHFPLEALEHDYDAEFVDPDCTSEGYTIYTCRRCFDTYIDDFIDALGHDHQYGGMVEPSCEERGFTIYACTRCGDGYEADFIDALGHDHVGEVTEPTCTEDGYTTYTCSRCGDSYIDDYVGVLDHNYELTETVEPDCTSDGYSVYTCTGCGDWYYDDFEAPLGHAFMHEYIIDVEPTCTERGEAHTMCERCYHVEHFLLEALEHDYDAEFVDPDCTSEGYTIYTCRRCFDTFIDDFIEALGHEYVQTETAPDCTSEGYTTHTCTRCADEYTDAYVDALGHEWGEWIVDVIATDMHEGSSHRDCIRGDLTEYKTIALIVVDAAAGDMDADGRYTNADIALLVRYLSGWDIWSDGGFASLSDVNADGKVNNRDALSLIKTVYEAELAQKYEGYTPIKTADDLEKIREDLSGKYYLVCDITLEGEWITIADSTGSAFEGIIEGNGHKIKGVYINKNVTDPTCVGFVGYNKGVINNLTVEGEITIVNGQNKNTMYAGGIAGYNYGRIENSVGNVKIIASNRHAIGYVYAGGIAGYCGSAASIAGCTNNAPVASYYSTNSYAGGIAGYANSASIENCKNYAKIDSKNYGGGILGQAKTSTVCRCENFGRVYANEAGGIAGVITDSAVIKNCYNGGIVSGGSYAGGIASRSYATIQDCYNTVQVAAATDATSCYSGGIVGINEAAGVILRCYSIGKISANSTYENGANLTGGIAGGNWGAVTGCYFLDNMRAGVGRVRGEEVVTKITAEQMKLTETFVEFDFASVWQMSDSMPILR